MQAVGDEFMIIKENEDHKTRDLSLFNKFIITELLWLSRVSKQNILILGNRQLFLSGKGSIQYCCIFMCHTWMGVITESQEKGAHLQHKLSFYNLCYHLNARCVSKFLRAMYIIHIELTFLWTRYVYQCFHWEVCVRPACLLS